MATSPKAPNAGQADAAPAKSKKMILILLGAILVLLIAGGAGAWFMLGKGSGNGAQEAKQAPSKPPVFMNLEPFTVNLQMDEGMQQFLQVGMTLQVAEQAHSDAIKLYLPEVRGRLLMLLSSKKGPEILSVEGKKQLASDIQAQFKEIFLDKSVKPEVSDVFFTSFVVQ